ncbi:MAG: alpha/beta fold hydrolase [Acidobacteriaceae bacterium]|nr:alpha/beta fold hydrolase [Acidobacteriaceae bacterium]
MGLILLCGCSSMRSSELGIDKLRPCTDTEGPSDGYCGKVEVWENRTARTGRKIALNVVVLPALRRNAARDPLFFLAGGPGQGAAKLVNDIHEIFRPIQQGRDLVFVDQRGTGDSNGLKCKPEDEDEESIEFQPEQALERLRTCLSKLEKQADLRLYTTPIAMDDLDDVRQFLNYDRINLYGGSYGTRAAIVYTRRHREHVRAVIIDSVAPTNMRLPLYMARDSQRALSLLFRDCDLDPRCKKQYPDLAGRFERLMASLDAHPRKVNVINPRTGEQQEIEVKRSTIASSIFAALYSSKTASLLPLLIEQAERGDFNGFLAFQTTGSGIESNMAEGMHFSVVCTEDAPRISSQEVEQQATGTFVGAELARWRMKVCAFWPHGEVDQTYYDNTPSDVPALVLSGELDPVTPPMWGQQVASVWKNARHIVVPGTGHGALFSGCLLRLANQFLDDGTAAHLDTSCVQRVRRAPFFLAPYGPDPMGTGQ